MINNWFLCVLMILLSITAACRSAAVPVSVGNKPVSVNGVPSKDAPPVVAKPLEEMSWTGLDGKIEKLKDHRGKAVILDFWATYCPPCIEEIPHLMALQQQHGAENLEIVGLNVGGPEDRPKIGGFVERLKINYPIAIPEDALSTAVFGADTAIPQTAVFDRNGRLVKKIVGFDANIRQELDAAVKDAVASGT